MNSGRGRYGPVTIEARSIEYAAAKPKAVAKTRLKVQIHKVAKTDFISSDTGDTGCPEESFRGRQKSNFTQRIFITAKVSRVTCPAS
jgi:hypothetical protein